MEFILGLQSLLDELPIEVLQRVLDPILDSPTFLLKQVQLVILEYTHPQLEFPHKLGVLIHYVLGPLDFIMDRVDLLLDLYHIYMLGRVLLMNLIDHLLLLIIDVGEHLIQLGLEGGIHFALIPN